MRPTSGSIQRSEKAMKISVGDFEGGGVIVHTSLVPHLFCSPIPSPFAKRMDTTS